MRRGVKIARKGVTLTHRGRSKVQIPWEIALALAMLVKMP
jgi:hypothetical protein